MKRTLAVLAFGLGAATSSLAAQSGSAIQFRFFYETGDTVYAALAGGETSVVLTAFDQASAGVGAFTVRVYFDPARVGYVAGSAASACPDSATFPLNPPVQGPTYVEFSASGCAPVGSFGGDLVRFRLRLEPGPATGAVLYADPVSVSQSDGTPRPNDGEAALAEICLGTTVWGDVDADGAVGSRDALIALAGAVGLPTGGFTLSYGDVDSDGRVTSRDALFMLSRAVELPTFGSRTGQAIAEHCAPQVALPDSLYYQTEGGSRATPGVSGLTIRVPGDTAFAITGDSAANFFNGTKWRPRVSPADGSVLVACYYNTSNSQICRRDAGGALTLLTSFPFNVHESPDWSPAGDSIIYVRDGQTFIMDAGGGGQSAIPGTPSFVNSVAWNPQAGSRVIAYTTQGSNGAVHTRNLDTGADAVVAAGDFLVTRGQPDLVDWNPAGDSLAFAMFIDNKKAVIIAPAIASAPLTKRVSSELASANEPLWRSDGIVFQLGGAAYGQLYFRRNDGTVVRLTRVAQDLHFPGTKK
jgi:hypothetical protein